MKPDTARFPTATTRDAIDDIIWKVLQGVHGIRLHGAVVSVLVHVLPSLALTAHVCEVMYDLGATVAVDVINPLDWRSESSLPYKSVGFSKATTRNSFA